MQTTQKRIRLATLTLGVTALFAMVACGSDDAPAAAVASATQPPAPPATQAPAPTATQAPAPTATQVPMPTATQAPMPTATQAPMPTVDIESLSAADRIVAGLPEATPESSAAAEGSPEEAVLARFEEEVNVMDTLRGRSQLLALQDFCPPDQRLTGEEITPEMGVARDAILDFIASPGSTGNTIDNVTALITIPQEALVLSTTGGAWSEQRYDLAVQWSEIDGEWYHTSCLEDLIFGVPTGYFG